MELLVKDPDASLSYSFDWSDWLATGDTVVSADWTVPAGLTGGTESSTTTTTTITLSGGTAGTFYTVTCRATTADGLVEDRSFRLWVAETDGLLVTLDDAKTHLKVDGTDEDAYILGLIRVAEEMAARKTNRTLRATTRTAAFDGWPETRADYLRLPYPPVTAVSSVVYVDTDGTEQTLATTEYLVVTDDDAPARVYLAPLKTWPDVQTGHPQPITVTYTAGYADLTNEVLTVIRQAMLLMLAAWFEHREAVVVGASGSTIPMSAEYLLASVRVGTGQ